MLLLMLLMLLLLMLLLLMLLLVLLLVLLLMLLLLMLLLLMLLLVLLLVLLIFGARLILLACWNAWRICKVKTLGLKEKINEHSNMDSYGPLAGRTIC